MSRAAIVCVAALLGCDPVVLRVEAPAAPRDAAPVVVTPPADDPSTACAPRCAGGRRCVAHRCTPHWLPIAAPEVSAAEPRVGHFAVWTGTEVIVWGGHNPREPGASGLRGDGFRYNPSQGEVRPLPQQSAPSPRFADGTQTAVWTGTEMIIWGGQGANKQLTDGAAYEPSTNRWVSYSGATAMAPRAAFTTVFEGGSLLLLGAGSADESWRWEPLAGRWVRLTPGMTTMAPPARRGHTAVWTGAELLVWGGVDAGGRAVLDGSRFSPSRGRSRPIASAGAPAPRADHSAVWTSSEMIVFGGRSPEGAALAAPSAYVPALDVWHEVGVAGAPSPRYGHVAVWTGHSLVVWGGTDGARPLDDGAEYDPWDQTWVPLERVDARGASAAREGAAGVWTGSEFIVVGGTDGSARLDPMGWRYQP